MRKFKHLWITLMTVVLAVSLIAGGAGMSALAWSDADRANVIPTTGLVLPTSVKLGEKIKLGTTDSSKITVKAPNGSKADIVDGGTEDDYVNTKMVGNYTIEYTGGTAPNAKIYKHNVNVKLDGTFEFRVKDDGASLPTYVNPEADVELPEAALYKFNEDTEEYEKCASDLYSYDIFINNAPQTRNSEGKYNPVKFSARTHSVQYVCTFGTTKQNFVKEYTVKSQKDFKDTVSPKMSISGIPLQGSLNTKITLPKATATDDYDANVRIVITVKRGTEEVKRVELDDYGYAKAEKTEKVEFDNVYNLNFYPTVEGDYLIEYQAFDDAGNKSVKQSDTLVVSDRSAPKLEKIEESQIPSKWGKSVKTKESEAANADQPYIHDKKIMFPMPEYSDNSLSENIKVSFEIRDTVNNTTVIKFVDIYSSGNDAKYVYEEGVTSKGYYRENATFGKDGFEFDFNKYIFDGGTPTGKYTATYQASDAKPNITSKSYDITLEETFDDIVAPDVTIETDEYIYVSSEEIEYTLPTAKISDAIDANPTVDYLLKFSGAKVVGGDAVSQIKVENGSEIKISDTKITYDKVVYTYTGDITVRVDATDDVGNPGSSGDKKINIVSSSLLDANLSLDIKDTALNSKNPVGNVSFQTGKEADLGSLTIEGVTENDNYRKFLGFELTLQNPKNEVISGLSLETYYKKVEFDSNDPPSVTNGGAIQINKIAFTPSVVGDYTLTVRAFDVSGKSIVKAYTINVVAGTGTAPEISATPIPTTGSIQMSYKLKNETIKNPVNLDSNQPYVVRKISNAGKFSLMGIEFTAYSTGTYNFVDGYYTTAVAPATEPGFTKQESYTLAVSDTSSPVFSLIDRMPTHWDKDKEIILPEIIAYNDYANAKIDISVSSPANTLTLGTQLKKITAAEALTPLYEGKEGQYKFTPALDGEYTVTYTASVNNSAEVKQTYKIKVGDVTAPSFKLVTSHPTTAAQEGEFVFSKVDYDTNANTDDKIEDATFTKKLIDPSGETVYTTSAKGITGRDKIYDSTDKAHKYSMTGTYTVEYTVTDKVGNVSTIKETIVVSAAGKISPAPLKILRNVLIIVGIILLGGVIVYFARYYGKGNNAKRKTAKESSKKK